MAIVRVIKPCIVSPTGGSTRVLHLDEPFPSDHPIVAQFPWAFRSDNDVEEATARPGERRTTRRPA